jgi:hypothetical protein
LRSRGPCGKDRPASKGLLADSRIRARCRSSVVEHSIGNGEVDSSILSGSTIPSLGFPCRPRSIWLLAPLTGNGACSGFPSISATQRPRRRYLRPRSASQKRHDNGCDRDARAARRMPRMVRSSQLLHLKPMQTRDRPVAARSVTATKIQRSQPNGGCGTSVHRPLFQHRMSAVPSSTSHAICRRLPWCISGL